MIYHYKFVKKSFVYNVPSAFCLGAERVLASVAWLYVVCAALLCVCYKSPSILFLERRHPILAFNKLLFCSHQTFQLRNCRQGVIIPSLPLAFHSQSSHCPGWTQSRAVGPAEGGVQTAGARGSFIHLGGGEEFPIHFLEMAVSPGSFPLIKF